jgi:hypothetical protein
MNLMSSQGGVDAGQERVTSSSSRGGRHPATLTEIARARGSGAGASTLWDRFANSGVRGGLHETYFRRGDRPARRSRF